MPYDKNSELPDQVRNNASSECQTVFRKAYNSIQEDNPDLDESDVFQRAWGAMKDSCSKSNGEWTKQSTNMKLEVLTNEIEPRTEVEDGTEYTVIPIRFIKSMNLDKGYVPEREIQQATMDWDGTPIISDHPQDEMGRFVSVHNGDKSVIGEIRDPQSIVTNDTVTMGEAWIDPEAVQDPEDEAVLEAIRNGETLSVSSAYVGERLPAGEYDGEEHEQVRGNLDPDHVAVFESKEGRCSIEDGCFVGPHADMSDNEVMVNVSPVDEDDTSTDDSGNSDEDLAGNRETARRPNFSGTTTGEWSKPSFTDYVDAMGIDANQVRDLNNSQKSTIAGMTLLGDANADTFGDLVVFPVVDPESRNLSERALNAVQSGRGASADVSGRALESARAVAESLKEDHFDDQSNNVKAWNKALKLYDKLKDKMTMTEESKTDVLVNEHGFDRENLPPEESECFGRIYDKFAANEEEEEESEPTETESKDKSSEEAQGEVQEDVQEKTMDEETMKDVLGETLDEKGFVKQDELGEAVADAIAANQEREEKSDLVEKIVANSDEHDVEDKETLMDSPKSVLESLASNLDTKSVDYSALRGTSANISSTEETDGSSLPSMKASERLAEMESGE